MGTSACPFTVKLGTKQGHWNEKISLGVGSLAHLFESFSQVVRGGGGGVFTLIGALLSQKLFT